MAGAHQVVDADGTQLRAIFAVSQGRNLLIQGPPGTGKSQTIANLIADAIGRGKTVLFVAEKRAALDVVKRRLEAIGLGEVCLEIHSHKSRKKGVLEALRRTLALDPPPVPRGDDELALWAATRQGLDAYFAAVNTPIGVSGLTPHDACGHWLELRSRLAALDDPPPPLEVPGAAAWSGRDLKRKQLLVAELRSRLGALGNPAAHPFWGSRRVSLAPGDTARLLRLIGEARKANASLRAASGELAGSLHLDPMSDRPGTERLLRAARPLLKALPADRKHQGVNVASPDWTAHRGEIEEWLDAGLALRRITDQYASALLPEVWDATGAAVDFAMLRRSINGPGRQWWGWLAPGYRQSVRTLEGICRGAPPRTLADRLALIDAVLDARRHRAVLKAHEPLAAQLFGPRAQGERSPFPALARLTEATRRLHDEVRKGKLPESFLASLDASSTPPGRTLRRAIDAARRALADQRGALAALTRFLEFDQPDALADLDFDALDARLATWSEHSDSLAELAGFEHLARRLAAEGLEALCRAGRKLAGRGVAPRRRVPRALVRAAPGRRLCFPARAGGVRWPFARAGAGDVRRAGATAARDQPGASARAHWDNLPRVELVPGGPLATLRRELEKKSRHLPLRSLLARAGPSIRKIKPVFLMSPLSVASYLAPSASEAHRARRASRRSTW